MFNLGPIPSSFSCWLKAQFQWQTLKTHDWNCLAHHLSSFWGNSWYDYLLTTCFFISVLSHTGPETSWRPVGNLLTISGQLGKACVTGARLQSPNQMFPLILNQVLRVFHCNEHLHPIVRKINVKESELAHSLQGAPIASVNTLWVPQSRFYHLSFKFYIFLLLQKIWIHFSFFF